MYNKIAQISPYVEVELRKIYWKNIRFFKKFRPERTILPATEVKWNEIIHFLNQKGVSKGSLVVVHSSYKSLKSTGLSPGEIVFSLRDLVGDEGTVAMPVIRNYKEDPKLEEILGRDISDVIFTYDTQKSEIWTGALPLSLTREKDVIVSRHPLNSMAAVGKLAIAMMADNIKDDYSTPCGKNSSWAFCYENNAIIIGLGIDLNHSLTMRLVAEDYYLDEWPIKNWYRKRVFDVIDGNFKKRINVLERDPKWGLFYLAEVNLRNDLIRNKILTTFIVEGLTVEIVLAKSLIDFLRSANRPGYPYYVPDKYLI